ncbi:homeodomain-interacting protein kinase 1-like [Etheostoma spectabile]|uniref:homeodomain-interacting protein kinase 1-like n=1 Tax=Etheostoma spectabile TaxID=54343 RepID=UPI0013AF2C63|nr:homeodomain-interacting protein kinase 1-like [Etheostoma spectabile]
MGNTPTSISPDSNLEELYSLPRKYEVLKLLGQGNFGAVLKCLDQDTKKTVAIKVAKVYSDLNEEASMMRVLMDNNLDQQNIVKFYGGFWMNKYLVFEVLDISLKNYLCKREAPMSLQDIRTVIQQLATAFDALTTIGVIHTDVKTTNIMLVDHVRQPLKVKLIDFGLAIFKSKAKHVKIHQTPFFR